MMNSTPPAGGPSFNQMMLVAMIIAILFIMGLLVFDPRVRLERTPVQPAVQQQQPQPVYNGN